ncbi:MAG: glycosyltransferase family 39 protein, partial [bacterium]|nr:glycosyltransferase family 39 protein [bacterium]
MYLLLANSLLRLVFILIAPITGDEAMHYVWSKNLNVCYPEHPALVAYSIRLFTELFGRNFFGLRFVSWISLIFVYLLLKRLSKKYSIGFSEAVLFTPLFFVFGVLALTDGLFILMWCIYLYLFIECVIEKKNRWVLLGIVLGMCLNSKLIGFFILPSVIFYAIFFDRTQLRNAGIYFSSLIGLILFLPALIWNINNGFFTFSIRLGHQVVEGFTLVYFLEFITTQLFLISPFIVVPVLFSIKFDSEIKRILISFFLPLFLFMILYSIKGRVAPHWAAASYLAGFLLLDKKYLKFIRIG